MIKKLSDERRFPRIGKLKIGIKTDQDYPKSIDYFRATGKYAAMFHDIFGEKPNEIDIVFPPFKNEDDILSHYYRYYKASGLYCMGDGETAHRANDKGIMEERECPCEHLDSNGKCSESLRLTFMVPKIPVIGVWQLTTRSANTRLNTFSSLHLIRAFSGTIAGIPMSMSVAFEKVNIAGNPNKFPVITITPKVTPEQILQIKAGDTPGIIYKRLIANIEPEKVKEAEIVTEQSEKSLEPKETFIEIIEGIKSKIPDAEFENICEKFNLRNWKKLTDRETQEKFYLEIEEAIKILKELEKEKPKPESESEQPPISPDEKRYEKNYKILEEFAELKAQLIKLNPESGKKIYYETLAKNGFIHADEITDPKHQQTTLTDLKYELKTLEEIPF